MSSFSRNMRNVEIKAKVYFFQDFLSKVKEISDSPEVILKQSDTYFKVSNGRLKLRQIEVMSLICFFVK